MRVSETAPAKINLALHVTGRRADGYHLLDSLVVFADVSDELEAEPAAADRLAISGPFAGRLTAEPDNLVTRAVAAFRAKWPERLPVGLSLHLRKNLPIAAGLGGGSADAAAALRLLAGLSDLAPDAPELLALAETLGADVPVCLLSRPALMRGIGETLIPLAHFPRLHAVLVNPLQPAATAEVFKRLARRDNPPMPALPEPLTRPAQLALWLGETRNDLEAPAIALVPAIATILGALQRTKGAIVARMSGSGATAVALFGAASQAHQAAHDLRAAFPDYWVAAGPLLQPADS